jgi:hypothetical protein
MNVLLGNAPYTGPSQEKISTVIAGMTPMQLFEILSQMRTLCQQNHAAARSILVANPQLTKALFQVGARTALTGRGVMGAVGILARRVEWPRACNGRSHAGSPARAAAFPFAASPVPTAPTHGLPISQEPEGVLPTFSPGFTRRAETRIWWWGDAEWGRLFKGWAVLGEVLFVALRC